jgi:hypothetical protein
VTLADDLQATDAALAAGWPIQNLNRLRRARAMNTTTDAETASDYRELVERATPVLVEIRRAAARTAKMDVHDDDIAAAVLAVEPDAEVRHFPEVDGQHEFWIVETTEWRCFTRRRPAGK